MKTRLLSSAAILALGATGATAADLGGASDYYAPPASNSYAAPGIFGDVHLSATYFNADSDDDWSVDFGGVVTVPFGNGWNFAVEGDAGYLFDADEWVALGTAHIFYLNPTWAAGIFGTVTTEDQSSAGVEAAAFIGSNVDVIGTAEYMFEDPNFWGVTAAANVYFDPNTAITGTVGTAWSDDADDFQVAALGIEHRFDATPVSAYAEAGWTNLVDDAYSITGGARVVFGAAGSTLQEYNRQNPF
jgi:hypothetical protein